MITVSSTDFFKIDEPDFEQTELHKVGKPVLKTVTKNGKKISETRFAYKVNEWQGAQANYHQVYASNVTNTLYILTDEVSEPQIEKQETSVITQDRFGNITHEVKTLAAGVVGGLGGESKLDNQFKLENTTQYLSTGFNKDNSQHHHNVTIKDDQPALSERLLTYKTGMARYCSASDDIYFKPNDRVLLIHSAVTVPIVLERINDYYRYVVEEVTTGSDAQTRYSGKFVAVSEAEFNQADLSICGSYQVAVSETNGGEHNNIQISSATQSTTTFVTEKNEDFWKLSAPIEVTQFTTDLGTNTVREVNDSFKYYQDGLLANHVMTGSAYGSGGNGKHLKYAYDYDDYGNVTKEAVSGSDLYARQSITQYDSRGLFPDKLKNHYQHTTDINYDPKSGLLSQSISPNKQRKTLWAYDEFQRPSSETRPGTNNVTNYSYKLTGCASPHPQMSRCTTANTTDRGAVITQYDYAGREVRELHQDFNGKWVFRDTTWDRNGRKVSITRPAYTSQIGKKVAIVTFEYDERDREIKKQEPAADGGTATFSTEYNGLVTKITDARGFAGTMTQNVMGYILLKSEVLNASQTYTYYPDGKLQSTTDAEGNTTTIQYDNLGYRSHLDDPDMGKWNYNYNALGELVYKQDANKVITTIEYDRLGRKIKQNDGGNVSEWTYDKFGALGTLSSHKGNGTETLYYYNAAGLVEDITMKVDGESFTTRYYYDKYERVMREVRPNGKTPSNKVESLALEYVYNPFGYKSAVRSPKDYADDVFNSAEFRAEINLLIEQALVQAEKYLETAARYKQQEQFFTDKAAEYVPETRDVHHLDASSQALLGEGYFYRQWCSDDGQCYFRPAVWTLIHSAVTVPVPVSIIDSDQIYRIESTLDSNNPGIREYSSTVHKVSESEFNAKPLTRGHDWYLTDTANAGKALFSYVAYADQPTQDELEFASQDLADAKNLYDASHPHSQAVISAQRYQHYSQLAEELLGLVEQVAELSQFNCDSANQLAGDHVDASKRRDKNKRVQCENNNQTSHVDHLHNVLNGSELAESVKDSDYIYYWQRRDTDAFDHTLAETLGNGLANTYKHNPNTGRLDAIAAHVADDIFDEKHEGQAEVGRNIRLLKYTYDNHNNVKVREDLELGITDAFNYDGLDRLVDNQVILTTPDRHGKDNADFVTRFDFKYDRLGNIIDKTGIGAYKYQGTNNAGPHAVTQANGLFYTYDKVGNLLQAQAAGAEVERKLEWTAFNKPNKITRRGNTVEFFYDANHDRYKKISSDGTETIYVGKQYERITDTKTGDVQHKQFIYADGKLIALNTQVKDTANKLKDKQIRYLHYDALDSVDMITDGYGIVVERRSFDPWGKKRNVIWRKDNASNLVQELITNRGFTGHEHIEEVGLIHMNGRVYDQELGRFLSADPLVQAPFVVNSFNRYSYVMNNPLKYTDPTGFRFTESGENDGGRYTDHKGREHAGADSRRDNGRSSFDNLERHFKNFVATMGNLASHAYNPTVDLDSTFRKLTPQELKERFEIDEDELTSLMGLNMSIYYSVALDTYALSFAGTNKYSPMDHLTNVMQNFGFETSQYSQAMDIAQRVIDKAGYSHVIATGHSLGGGLASAVGVVTGIDTYTFNAAGLHPNTVGLTSFKNVDMSNIKAFTSPTDSLTNLQDSFPNLLNKAVGTRISVRGAQGHSLDSMNNAMNNSLRNTPIGSF